MATALDALLFADSDDESELMLPLKGIDSAPAEDSDDGTPPEDEEMKTDEEGEMDEEDEFRQNTLVL